MPACQPVITGHSTETDSRILFFSNSLATDDFFHDGDRTGLLNLPLDQHSKTL